MCREREVCLLAGVSLCGGLPIFPSFIFYALFSCVPRAYIMQYSCYNDIYMLLCTRCHKCDCNQLRSREQSMRNAAVSDRTAIARDNMDLTRLGGWKNGWQNNINKAMQRF
jgi:hypothetical protein